MKTTLSPQSSMHTAPDTNPSDKHDRNARFAFYFMMATIAAGLLYFLLLPFFL